MSDQSVCVICNENDERPTSKLGEKGCQGLIAASSLKGDSLAVSVGQVVHQDCRRLYCHPNHTRASKDIASEFSSPRTRKSLTDSFSFQEKCIFCGTTAKSTANKRGNDVFPVRTLDFQNSIRKVCNERSDNWGNTVLGRLEYAQDLPAVEARYHQTCSVNFRTGCNIPSQYQTNEQKVKRKKGRPSKVHVETAFLEIINYFENSETELVTISDLVKRMSDLCDEAYSNAYMKKRFLEHFGDSIIISEQNGKHDVVAFRTTAHQILHKFYKGHLYNDSDTQKRALLTAAAKLILNDIKSLDISKDMYPQSAEIMSLDCNLKYVPASLQDFLRQLIDNRNCEKKIASIGQTIVQASIPRSIIAPLQLGLGVQLHHQFGSRALLETLHSLGFCSSYQEVQKFERSAAAVSAGVDVNNNNNNNNGEFVQFVADNVDHNTCTLDGQNTFHGMGIIATVTPELKTRKTIPRIKVSNEELVSLGKIEIYFYNQSNMENMEMLKFKKLVDLANVEEPLTDLDFVFKISRPLGIQTPSWSGFMQAVNVGNYPGRSSVLLLPMIDMNPSDITCVYSTLHFVVRQSKLMNCKAILTFDQPLYWKALNIVTNEPPTSEVKSVVLRLGPFHTEMSFLGCIGRVMENSGLQELLETVYAPNTVVHMLTGKAFERAVRGHFLVDDALNSILIEKLLNTSDLSVADEDLTLNHTQSLDLQITKQEIEHIKSLISKDLSKEEVPSTDFAVQKLVTAYESVKTNLKQYDTAKLWLQYMEMIDILKRFITAERTGNWTLHLKALQQMLPYFAAAGHNLYLKSGYMYLQQMQELSDTNPDVYQAFSNGLHVVRRSNRFWAGLSTDLIIEQVLMRSVKSVGGLTRGRGITEAQRAQWILAMPATSDVNYAMQEFTECRHETSDQHKDCYESRKQRDTQDRQTFVEFLRDRSPFVEEVCLRNIETGMTADPSVNAQYAEDIGKGIVSEMIDKNVLHFTFKRTNQIKTLGTEGNLKVNGEEINIDPQLLFQRFITVTDNSVDDIEEVFRHELSANPSSLFDSSGLMREAQKPQLAVALWEQGNCGVNQLNHENLQYVLDGGSLIQRMPWDYGCTYESICKKYVDFVEKHYGKAYIVFDGYRYETSTKEVTHERRTKGKKGIKINFDGNSSFKSKKDVVLSNRDNKQRFIDMLGTSLEENGCHVLHADADADTLIVQTAITSAQERPTAVIGEDTDLLVLLCYHAHKDLNKLYLTSETKQNLKKNKIWDILQTQNTIGREICHLLPFIHAFSGCDTTSRIYGIGKGSFFKKTLTDVYLRQQASAFFGSHSIHEEVEKAGKEIFKLVFNGKKQESLNHLRLRKFVMKANTGSTCVQVQCLPPTEAAARFHSFRVYLQVQTWIGNQLNPVEWGWCLKGNKLIPVKTDLAAAPARLLKVIRCSCKVNCESRRCTCKKHGLQCSYACGECRGIDCSNKCESLLGDINN